MSPRVALLIDTDQFAGTERHIHDLARGLRRAGAEITIACPSAAPLAVRARADGLALLTLEQRGLVNRQAVRILSRLLRSSQIEILHAHNGRTALSAALAVRLANRGQCVLTQHFLQPDHLSRTGPAASAYRMAHRWVNAQAAHLIAISEAARTEILLRKEVPEHKITVVPNGIPDPSFTTLASRDAVRAELNLAMDAPLIVCVARLEPEKDIAALIAALPEVRAIWPRAFCVIVGDGSQESALREQIARAELNGTVRLLGFRSDPLSVVSAGDLLVLPSRAEPFGLVLVEAMALSKPVIARRAGGPCEIVKEGETGLLVPPGDPLALARAICTLLAAPETARQMGARGRERFQKYYTAERMARSTLAVYAQALRGSDGRLECAIGPGKSE